MSGRGSQRKGADGERELAALLQAQGYTVERGGSMTYGAVPDLMGLPGIHIEVKRVERLNVPEAMAQAVRDAARFRDGMPALFHRRNREPWLVTMRLTDWLELYRRRTAHQIPVSGIWERFSLMADAESTPTSYHRGGADAMQSNEKLVAAIQAGDREKLLPLWNQVERFVSRMAERTLLLSDCGAEYEDLYQSGYLALVAAVETYNPERGKSFVGWLAYSLQTAFAEAGGYRTKKQKHDPFHCAASLDAPVGEDEDALVDLLPSAAANPEDLAVESLYLRQLHDALEQAMQELTPRQASILRRRYYQGETREAIAAALHCTGANVSEQEKAALDRLYKARRFNGLAEYIETHTNYYHAVGPGRFQNTGTSAVEDIVLRRERLAAKWLKAHGIKK